MKKIVSLLIAVAMIATFLCTAAFAAGTGVVYGDSEVAAKPGDTVTLAIRISGNPGFDAAGLTATASAPLTVVSVSAGDKMPNGFANGNKVNHYSPNLVKGDGVMCYVTVKVADNAESKTYPVSISGYVTDTDVPVATISGGSVKVTAPETPTEPAETEPVVTEPVETKPVETEPVETKPVETEPVETKPVETEPVETKPVETEPVETKPVETEPVETKPVETEPKPTETEPKPTETEPKPTETEPKPTETEPKPSDEPTQKPTQKPTEPEVTKPGKDEQPKNGDVTPYPVFFLLAVMAVAATAFVLKRKFDV